MPVKDVFNLSNGSTILTGDLAAATGILKTVEGHMCRLLQDDVLVCDVRITSVVINSGPNVNRNELSLAIEPRTPLPSGQVFGDWVLKTVD